MPAAAPSPRNPSIAPQLTLGPENALAIKAAMIRIEINHAGVAFSAGPDPDVEARIDPRPLCNQAKVRCGFQKTTRPVRRLLAPTSQRKDRETCLSVTMGVQREDGFIVDLRVHDATSKPSLHPSSSR
jgi:hypothetical protein